MQRINFVYSDTHHEQLQALSDETESNVTAHIRQAIENYIIVMKRRGYLRRYAQVPPTPLEQEQTP